MDWRKSLLLISNAFVLSGVILGISCGIRPQQSSPQQSSLPNGSYNVGLVRFSTPNLSSSDDVTLTGVELTDKETILTVEYVRKTAGEIPRLQGVRLTEVDKRGSNRHIAEYIFLRSEPLSTKEPLKVEPGVGTILKFYFERLKGDEPKTLKFGFALYGLGDDHIAYFPVKKL